MRKRYLFVVAVLPGAIACGGDSQSGTAPITVGPTAVVLLDARDTVIGNVDRVTVSLKNNGGPGDFYLDFYGLTTGTVIGCKVPPGQTSCTVPPMQGARIGFSQSANVLTGYSQTVTYDITTGGVLAVRVMSRPVNSAVYSMTSCKTLSSIGLCPTS